MIPLAPARRRQLSGHCRRSTARSPPSPATRSAKRAARARRSTRGCGSRTCPTVAISWRTDAHDAVVVTCTGPDWRVFVPVRRATPVAATAAPSPSARSPRRRAIVVRRGDPVMIEAGHRRLLRSRARASPPADAAAGARVAVRVEGAAQPVQAVALANGRVDAAGLGRAKIR